MRLWSFDTNLQHGHILGTGTFRTNRWLASDGKQIVDLIRNQRHCLMRKITGMWGQLVNNGPVQGLKGRWLLTDGSLKVKGESNQVGREAGNVGGQYREGRVATKGWKAGMMSVWYSKHIHTAASSHADVTFPQTQGTVVFYSEREVVGSKRTLSWITVNGRHQN